MRTPKRRRILKRRGKNKKDEARWLGGKKTTTRTSECWYKTFEEGGTSKKRGPHHPTSPLNPTNTKL